MSNDLSRYQARFLAECDQLRAAGHRGAFPIALPASQTEHLTEAEAEALVAAQIEALQIQDRCRRARSVLWQDYAARHKDDRTPPPLPEDRLP